MKTVKKLKQTDRIIFLDMLKTYKAEIDEDINAYSQHVQAVTLQQYGADARLETDAFLEILKRGGKRIRGTLTIIGYEMSGGKFDIGAGVSHLDAGDIFSASTGRSRTHSTVSEAQSRKIDARAKSFSRVAGFTGEQAEAVRGTHMILQAARAIEMLHAYILIVDDIQDRSLVRRGGPAAHKALSDYHIAHKLAGDADNFGISIALNAAVAGAHAAQMILANIDAPEGLRLSALSIINRTMIITAHGQTSDIMHEAVGVVSMDDIERVMTWKTSQYSILNPLHVGMVLAGADCHATDAITGYAMNIGKAYQISDDILDTFGSDEPMDDIRAGKRTVLTVYALKNAKKTDKDFLIRMLGNEQLTPPEFERCKAIIASCGALEYAKNAAKTYIEQAIDSLNQESSRWSPESTQFLRGLAQYISTLHET